jgi:hypothetical protein
VTKYEPGSSVSIVTDCGLDERGSIVGSGKAFFLLPLLPDQLLRGPPSLLSSGYLGGFVARGKAWLGRHANHSHACSADVKND